MLIDEFGFPPDYRHRMGWVEFLAWQDLAMGRRWRQQIAAVNAQHRERYEQARRHEGGGT